VWAGSLVGYDAVLTRLVARESQDVIGRGPVFESRPAHHFAFRSHLRPLGARHRTSVLGLSESQAFTSRKCLNGEISRERAEPT